jgi:hypothetical protein
MNNMHLLDYLLFSKRNMIICLHTLLQLWDYICYKMIIHCLLFTFSEPFLIYAICFQSLFQV